MEILNPMLGEVARLPSINPHSQSGSWKTTLSFITSQQYDQTDRTLLNALRQAYGKEELPESSCASTLMNFFVGIRRSAGSRRRYQAEYLLDAARRAAFWQRFRIWQMKKPCRHCVKSMESDRNRLLHSSFRPMDGRMSFPSTRGPENSCPPVSERIPHSFPRTEELLSSIFYAGEEDWLTW